RAYDEFARRLAEDLELEPAPETRALMERLRAAASGRAGGIPAAARGRAAAPPTVAGATAEGATGAGAKGEGATVEGATVTHAATPHPTTIAILPFAVRGDARFGYLGEGLVHLVATKLDGAGALRTVDPRAVFHAIAEGEAAGGSADSLARRLGAGLVLDGAVVEAAGRLEVSAVLHRVGAEAATGASLARVHATAADEGELFDMVDELARQLLAAQEVTTGTRLTRIAARTTASLDALKPYLVGEGELRAGRYFDAMEQFQAAVDADPSFALAWYRLAAAAAGCAVPDYAREAADQGAAHQERLGPHDRLVLGAQRAWLHGAVDRAESLYTTITGAYPDDVEAWFHLGDLLFHCNPLRGRSSVEARGSFDRVLGLEPDHVAALVHLVRISALEGRAGEMISLIDRILTLSPAGDQALAMRALRAHATADRSEIAAVAAELQTARAITVGIAFADVALYSGDLAGAAALARGFLQAARAPELRALCHILLAHLALAGDDPATAATELAAAEGLDPTWGLEVRGLFAALPFLAPDEREIRRVRDALDRWDPAAVPPSSFVVFAMHNELHPAIRLYLLGLLELRLGNLPAAAGRLEELAELEAGGPLVRNFTVELDAALVRARGRPADALARLERARPELWFQLTVASPFFTLASQRFLRAQLLEELGRPAEAAGWYRSMAERSPYELIWRRAARQAVARLG
ncbi:MAG TPA: tetratricopeptide repeat protein, partial [Gemmatimonadales bacterium]|nr:tetratricopeptide repeat protein [Gemmatimonadales bacterium]